MADLRLEDIGGFFIAGGILVVLGFSALLIYVLWPQICLLLVAFWRRYFAMGDWRQATDRLADVNRFEAQDDRIMSHSGGIAGDRGGIEPPVPDLVLRHSDAADTGTWVPVPENLSREALLDILARQRVDNKYVFSGNKLAELFASTPHAASRNVILEEIARVRKSDDPPPKPAQRLERPVNGW